MENQPMYTVEAVANALAVKPETVRRKIRSGELTAYKIGSEHRIKASDIDAYIEANKINTNGES